MQTPIVATQFSINQKLLCTYQAEFAFLPNSNLNGAKGYSNPL